MKKNFAHAMSAASGLALAAALTLITFPSHAQGACSTLVRTSSFDYDANGLLIKEVVEPERPNDCLQTSYTHDSFGNRVSASTAACAGASGHTLSSASTPRSTTTEYAAHSITVDGTTYSSPAGIFPTRSTNALGQSEHKQYDPRHGGATRLTGPNGLVTTWAYDGFGRKTRETRADGTTTTWAYQLCQPAAGQPRDALCPTSVGPHSVAWYASEASFDATNTLLGPVKYQFHDTLERVVRVQTLDFAGQVIVQDTHYNALGQVSQKSILHRPAEGNPHWSSYTYDRLGRVLTETAPDGNGGQATTQFAYSGLATTVTNALGQTQTTHKNASGQTARIVDHLGSEVIYTHDALGQLTQTNAAGTVTRISYTQRGHKANMQDPAMGAWDYAYNAFGELVWQQDSLSQTSTMAYDALGRMTQRTEPDLVSHWHFDKRADNTSCGAGIGKLCEATANNGYRRLHTYDALGRPTSTATALDSATNLATVSQAYHPGTGRLTSQTWPTGYRASYTYTAQGFLSKVTGGGVAGHTQLASLEVLAMDPQGRITQYRQGNNVTTVKTHDQPTGKLHRVQATLQGQGAGNVLDHSYGYDKLGNLLTRTDASTGVAESFQYDALNRLSLYTVLGGGLSGAQSIQTLYDASGNLKYKSDVGYYHHDVQRPSRLNHITLSPGNGWSAIGAVTQPNTGTRALSYAFDDTRAGARSITAASGAGAQPMGNGNLWYTVSQDQATGRHTVRWETYTSFNMPREIRLGDLSPPATVSGHTCPQGYTLSATTCTSTSTSTAPATPVHGCPSGFTLNGTICSGSSSVEAHAPPGVCPAGSSYVSHRGGYCYTEACTYGAMAPIAHRECNAGQPIVQYSCPGGGTLSGTSCLSASSQPATIVSYSCAAGATLSGTDCVTTTSRTEPATPVYTCPSGAALSGTTCQGIQPTAGVAERTLSFIYGPEHQRIRQTVELTSNVPSHMEPGTTWYLNGIDSQGLTYEKEVKANGTTEHKHYLSAAGITFALYVKREGNNLNGKPATSISYFHHDHLGSIAVITDESGAVVERLAYDPWGKRRNANGMPDPLDALYGVATDRGYTMHEHLDEMGIVHMNGRIYDPLVGRFMSADPFIQAPGNLQSYNRYAYVLNNPLAYTDPSGYFFKKFVKAALKFSIAPTVKNAFNLIASQPGQAQIDRFVMNNPLAYAAGQIAASALTLVACGGCGGALWASYYAYQGTGSMTAAARAGAISLATAQGFTWAGDVGYLTGSSAAHFGAHALVGCVSTVAQGGQCGAGALSGIAGLAGTSYGLVGSAIAGGIGSVLGGGKFANGAVTGAFGYLFNNCKHANCWEEVFGGAKQGVGSYFKGLLDLPKHALEVNGAFGLERQVKALEGERAVVDALKLITDNPSQAMKIACLGCMNLTQAQEADLQGRLGGRLATASAISFVSGPVGAAASVGAITGNLLGAGVNLGDQAAVLRAILFGVR
jgi:RHS repeat-associated protein